MLCTLKVHHTSITVTIYCWQAKAIVQFEYTANGACPQEIAINSFNHPKLIHDITNFKKSF